MKKRAIAIALAFILGATVVAATAVAMAQEESTPQQEQQIRQDVFFQELDQAVEQGLITQEKADQIKELWQQKPEDERQHLYQRVMGFLDSKR